MKKATLEKYKTLTLDLQEAVKPFIEEWESLTYGETFYIKSYIGYVKSGVLDTDINIKAKFCWVEENKANYYLLTGNRKFPVDVCEFIVSNSPQFREFNNRIYKLIKDIAKVELEKFGKKDVLWDEFFWSLPYPSGCV